MSSNANQFEINPECRRLEQRCGTSGSSSLRLG
jgi:hypothetical protein